MTNSQMPRVAMIGDGQLARMTQTAAIELGLSLAVLAGDPESSAAQVVRHFSCGDYTDLDTLRAFSQGASAVTFDHEHVPNAHLEQLIVEGVNIQPRPHALIFAQDKLLMRRRLSELGLPVPPFVQVNSVADATSFWDDQDGKVVIKTRTGGYDGHGVWLPETRDRVVEIVQELLDNDAALYAEQRVTMVRELSALVARSPEGQGAVWPITQSVQRDGICCEAIAPAPGLDPELAAKAEHLALTIAEELGVTGVLAVELFEILRPDGSHDISVNELAMRPHNTGHWTQDGSVTSQFEQHLRAVLDYPLGSPALSVPLIVMGNILGAPQTPAMSVDERWHNVAGRFPQVKLHWYGKSERAGRKIGHVNVPAPAGSDPADEQLVKETRRIARLSAHFMSHALWLDGFDPHAAEATAATS